MTYILLIYCLLHTTYIHYLCVAQFPSDCKRKKEENKMSKKVSACKGGGNFRTFQDFYSRLKEVSIWKCYWSIVRWILRNKATFKQEAQQPFLHFLMKIIVCFPYRCHEKWTSQARDQEKMSTSEGTKNWGSIRHRPPPHPPLIDSCFVI